MKKTKRIIAVALAGSLALTGCHNGQQEETESRVEITTETTLPYSPPSNGTEPDSFTPSQQPAGMDDYDSRIISMAEQMQDASTIWRDAVLTPEDPECLDSYYAFGNPYFSTEGKVYANDRVIAIDIPAASGNGETYTFTFGLVTGEYNQFLYLQPQCSVADTGRPVGYYITTEYGNGNILSREETIECDMPTDHIGYGLNTCNYFIPEQAYDILAPATYSSPVTPGVAWYTDLPLKSEYAIVNVRAVDLQASSTIAMIRLYIAKDTGNGTYYLHHAENRNLLQTKSTQEVSSEVQDAAMNAAYEYLLENELLTIAGPNDCDYMMEYLDGEVQRYYFDTLVPIYTDGLDHTMESSKLPLPVLAITINESIYGEGPNTLYIGVFGNAVQVLAHDLLYPHDTALCLERFPDERLYD